MSTSQNQPLQIAQDVVARKNQDGTMIVMRLDESSVFYKIDGVAAQIWSALLEKRSLQNIIENFCRIYPEHQIELPKDISNYMQILMGKGLVSTTDQISATDLFQLATTAGTDHFHFGGIQEFSLEQIETEVLNESAYLNVFAGSDLRLKLDVQEMPSTLTKLQKLDAITYKLNPEVKSPWQEEGSGTQAGLIAQQVAEAFPELVRQDQATGFYAINYSRLTTHLLVAVKELQQQINQQNQKIKDLESQLSRN